MNKARRRHRSWPEALKREIVAASFAPGSSVSVVARQYDVECEPGVQLAQVNVAIRWFTGYALHEKLPDHSSLTRIRQRWGEQRFRKIFKRTVEDCVRAKIATAEVVHIDASLIRANVSWDKGRTSKGIVISHDYPALLRARRRRERWSKEDRRLYQRHRWRSEGFHGEAKTWHGLARAVRRGLANMKIQAYLTAAAINLKRLAAA